MVSLKFYNDSFPDDLDWKPHFFVLTQNKVVYSEVPNQADDAENEDDDMTAAAGPGTASRANSIASGITGTFAKAKTEYCYQFFA
jgi:hypothetical protein